ncbi:hypothetical protein P1X15_22960 [Runella sp. MFBS21]|uniref:hypothetical protein n=1 Tax=Runella sp. MFBS21 TaxID=3034018 RepID=UPI0023F66F93|nr:hypothetical protein [Runella sp. MFBS21]MDF7820502.1 hypothetical protein [Runella sp. MFBS21]
MKTTSTDTVLTESHVHSFQQFIVALVTIPIVGWLYAYALWYIPVVFLRIVALVLILVPGAILATSLVKIRALTNQRLVMVGSFLGSGCAFYISWAIWLSLALNLESFSSFLVFTFPITHVDYSGVAHLVFHPSEMFSLMTKIATTGVWAIRGNNVSGGMLYIVWIVEFFAVLIGTWMMVITILTETGSPQK